MLILEMLLLQYTIIYLEVKIVGGLAERRELTYV